MEIKTNKLTERLQQTMTVVIRDPIVSLEKHSGQGDEGVVEEEDEGEIRSALRRLYLMMELK